MSTSKRLQTAAALGLSSLGLAAADCSAPSGTLTVGADNIDAITACKTFTGSIAIATDVWDTISLDGIEEITGSLSVEGAKTLTTISADSLTSVGSFEMSESSALTVLDFPQLASVETIELSDLPMLWDLDLASSLEQCSSIEVRDTFLASLELGASAPERVVVENNEFLWAVTVHSQVVTEEISITGNGGSLDVSFPQLESAHQVTVGSASALSMPALTSINSSLVIKDGVMTAEYLDLTALESIGGDLEISGNWELSEISLPALTSIGGDLKITDNSASAIYFESLETVGGDVTFSGDIEEVSFSSLKEVTGSFDISGATGFSCSSWDSLDSVVKGGSDCGTSEHAEPSTPVATPTASRPASITRPSPVDITETPVHTPAAEPSTTPAEESGSSTPEASSAAPTPAAPGVPSVGGSNGTAVLTPGAPAPTTPGAPGATPGAPGSTPGVGIPPYEGSAASVVVGPLVGLVSAALLFFVL